ncbi:MAG: hypothetical protein JSS96_11805, partial [Bacteroidetes bacterium]|nr:hypothetical protein [Bacteroidota bacterium]
GTIVTTVCSKDGDAYRYGFNGKLKDNEWSGIGNSEDYGFRMLDTRIGRFRNVDPLIKQYPMLTPFQYASDRPTTSKDIDGKEAEDLESEKVREELEDPYAESRANLHEVEKDDPTPEEMHNGTRAAVERAEDLRKQNEAEKNPMTPMGRTSGERSAARANILRRIFPNLSTPNEEAQADQEAKPEDRSIEAARRRGIRRAWKQERDLLRKTGRTSTNFSESEKDELDKTGKVKGYHGHHINSVQTHPEQADDPDNIEFVKPDEHLQRHKGNYRNPTSGPKIIRTGTNPSGGTQ